MQVCVGKFMEAMDELRQGRGALNKPESAIHPHFTTALHPNLQAESRSLAILDGVFGELKPRSFSFTAHRWTLASASAVSLSLSFTGSTVSPASVSSAFSLFLPFTGSTVAPASASSAFSISLPFTGSGH